MTKKKNENGNNQILVLVEDGQVRAVTHAPRTPWKVFDWDKFRLDPISYWEEKLDAKTRAHIKRYWPDLYEEISDRLTDAEIETLCLSRLRPRRS